MMLPDLKKNVTSFLEGTFKDEETARQFYTEKRFEDLMENPERSPMIRGIFIEHVTLIYPGILDFVEKSRNNLAEEHRDLFIKQYELQDMREMAGDFLKVVKTLRAVAQGEEEAKNLSKVIVELDKHKGVFMNTGIYCSDIAELLKPSLVPYPQIEPMIDSMTRAMRGLMNLQAQYGMMVQPGIDRSRKFELN